jgi:hypothetical protein
MMFQIETRIRQNTASGCADSGCYGYVTQGRMVFPSVRSGQHHEEQCSAPCALATSCATIGKISQEIVSSDLTSQAAPCLAEFARP